MVVPKEVRTKQTIAIQTFFQLLIIVDGCMTDDGTFARGGETWSLPGCKMGICAKTLNDGWQVATEECNSIVNNPQYNCAVFPDERSVYPDCCPKPVECGLVHTSQSKK